MQHRRYSPRLSLTNLEDRLTPTGVSLDTTFATSGRFLLSNSLNFTGVALKQVVDTLPDGHIVVGTTATAANGNSDFAVFRLSVDGTLDTTFGTNGVVTIPFDLGGANTDVLTSMVITPDGRITVAGYSELAGGNTNFAAARLLSNGVLDTSFGTSGKTVIAFDRGGLKRDGATSMAIDSQSRVVLAGYSELSTNGNYEIAVARLTSAGVLDAGFATTGKVTLPYNLPGGVGIDKAAAVAIGANDSVLVAGSAGVTTNVTASAVAKLTSAGFPDNTFGTAGRVSFTSIVSGLTSANSVSAMSVLSNGQILIAGTFARSTATNTDMYVGRLSATGAADTTFGTNGFTPVAFDRGGQNADVANAMTVDSAGNILVAGAVEFSTGGFNYGVARMTANGAIDPAFSTNGEASVAFDKGSSNADAATDVAVAADGRIVLVGPVQLASGDYDTGVARLQLTSSLASRLMTSGIPSAAAAYEIAPNGKYAFHDNLTPFATADMVRAAVGDVDGDGAIDTVYVSGPNAGSRIRVRDDATGREILPAVAAYEVQFNGGLYVAVADINNDGKADIIVSPDVGGGGRIQIFTVTNKALIQEANFFGIDDTNFRGGARVAVGDVNGDGVPDLLVGAGTGGGPRVALFDGTTLLTQSTPSRLIGDFFAFPGPDATQLRNGVFASLGDVNGDGKADMIFGGGPGGGPRIYALDASLVLTQGAVASQNAPLANFFVGNDTTSRGGVRLTVKDIDSDSYVDVITASGDGQPASITVYPGRTFQTTGEPISLQTFSPFPGAVLASGVYVG